jgi:hypothetical protein
MKTAIRFSPLVLLLVLGLAYGQSSQNPNKDREAIIALEQEWLHAHDAPTLESILAPDFVHVVPVDLFLKKQQHIVWVVAHPGRKIGTPNSTNSTCVCMAMSEL